MPSVVEHVRLALLAALLVVLLVLGGCLGGSPVATTGTPTSSTATPDSSDATAHFVLNNHHATAFDVAVYVVARGDGSREYVPLDVTLRNGTTVTVTDTGSPPPVPPHLSVNATRIEPANGTLAAVERELPARSTLHVAVQGVPADAKPVVVLYRQGDDYRPVKGLGLSSRVCTGRDASVKTYRPENTTSVACGAVSDRDFPASTVTVTVAADETDD